MYKIDIKNKRTKKIKESTFADIGVTERNDIQEWIANNPNILEYESDLLIIQKEFDGFNETNRRLDLLALDNKGNLVIIENKRDDSGVDVTWQAINYASFCSTLTRQDIITIYEEYLRKNKNDANAEQKIHDFFNNENIIYPTDTQKIILVAHNFRKEVLSAVQWLNNNGLDITCVKFTPYEFNDEIFLDVDRILPQEEIKDYTLGLSRKAADNKMQEAKITKSTERNLKFWKFFSDRYDAKSTVFENINSWDTTKDNWKSASARFGKGLSYIFSISDKESRVELYIDSGKKDYNKKIFDVYYAHKSEIQKSLSNYNISWERLDEKRASRIAIKNDKYMLSDENNWDNIADFLKHTMNDLISVLSQSKYKKTISEIEI